MKKLISYIVLIFPTVFLSAQAPILDITDACPGETNGKIEVELIFDPELPEWPYQVEFIGDGHDYYTIFSIQDLIFEIDSLPAGNYECIIDMQDEYEMIFCADILERELPQLDPVVMDASGIDLEDGSIHLHPAANYSYIWAHDPSLSGPIANQLNPSYYCVTISDGSCERDTCLTVLLQTEETETALEAYVNIFPSCNNGNNTGAADVIITNGEAPYNYEWFSGETTSSIHDKAPGTYKLKIVDANGLSKNMNVIIPESEFCFELEKSIVHPICGEMNGSIYTGADNQDYGENSFSWSKIENGQEEQISQMHSLTDVGEGMYIFRVTSGGELLEVVYIIGKKEVNIDEIDAQDSNVVGGSHIIPYISGGQKPYDYIWSGPSIDENNINRSQQYDILPGTYCFTVTDFDQCSKNDCVQISGTCDLISEILSSPSCPDGAVGAIAVEVNDPSSLYEYEFVGSNNGIYIKQLASSSGKILPKGEYQVIVTNLENNCSESIYVTITDDYYELIEEVEVICQGEPASINIIPSGGDGNYSFMWSTGETTPMITVTETGDYTYTLTDGLACEYVSIIDVDAYNPNVILVKVDGYECVDNETKAIIHAYHTGNVLDIVRGVDVDQTYCYRLSHPNDPTCYDEKCVSIDQKAFVMEETTGYGCVSNTTIGVPTFEGGIAPFTYQWNTGETTAEITPAAEGVYSVTLSDETGCTKEVDYDVVFTEELLGSIPPSLIEYEVIDGDVIPSALHAEAMGGYGSYQYIWSNGQTGQRAEIDGPGLYCLTITDECINNQVIDCINLEMEWYNPHINSTDLLDFPPECSGAGEKIKLNLFPWPWDPPFIPLVDTITVVWPNLSGNNPQTSRVKRFWKEGKPMTFRLMDGPSAYTITNNDLNQNLPIQIFKEEGIILDVWYYFASSYISNDNYLVTIDNTGVEVFTTIMTGYVSNCIACGYLDPLQLPSGCNAGYEAFYFQFKPININDPCGAGILELYGPGGSIFYNTSISSNGTLISNVPSSIEDKIACKFRPGCIWDPGVIYPFDQLPDFPLEHMVYASICDVDIPVELLCDDDVEPILEHVDDCLYSYQCLGDLEINYIELNPTSFKIQYSGTPTAFRIIEHCESCLNEDGTNGLDEEELNLVYEDVFHLPEDEAFLNDFPLSECVINSVTFQEGEITHRTMHRSVHIYPNPVKGSLMIRANAEIRAYSLMNAQGIQVLTNSFPKHTTNQLEIDLQNITEGIYFLTLETTGQLIVRKIIRL